MTVGGSGYACGHGGSAYYILGYGCLAYIISYWMLPPLWRYAREHRLISQPDCFATRYESPALGILVAVVGIATVAATSLTHTTMATLFPGLPEALRDLNIGIVALALNVLTLAVVSAITGRNALARSA